MAEQAGHQTLIPGATLGGLYTVESALSRGAMGAVYVARHDVSGDRVAIKVLLEQRNKVRFEIESRLLARLDHPRVPRVVDYFADGGASYLVMDLVEGADLHAILKERKQIPAEEAVEYCMQAAEALAYVHSEQIIHRDVKPQNLIIGENGVALVDFGIAREVSGLDEGTVGIGTPRYMAPEVFAGGVVSPRSDVFGLAATLWTMIAGKAPTYGEPQRLTDLAEAVDEDLEAAIRGGLALDPEQRFQTVQAFAAALGSRLTRPGGTSLVLTADLSAVPSNLLERVVRAAAGVFEAAAASIALRDPDTRGLRYEAAWGAGANEIVGVTLEPGQGLAGAVSQSGEAVAVGSCRTDPRFASQVAAKTGYVPHTMALAPLKRDGRTVGVLSVLDRRDGNPYGPADLVRLELFTDIAAAALESELGEMFSSPTLPG